MDPLTNNRRAYQGLEGAVVRVVAVVVLKRLAMEKDVTWTKLMNSLVRL